MSSLTELTDKHIIVTGASSGLGREICKEISSLGARVSLIARREEKLKETIELMKGVNHRVYGFDVCKIEQIEDLVAKIVEYNGKVDGFVHAAGIGTMRPLSMTNYDFMLEMMKIHLFSFVEFSRILGKKKNTNDYASLVAVSTAGTMHCDKGKVAYVATKGALDKVVRAIAVELGESRKIRINTINPGWIKTDMFFDFIKDFGEEKMEKLLEPQLLGLEEPEEVAKLIAFLLSDSARKITGQNLIIDGGLTLH